MPDRQGCWGVEPLVTKLAASTWNVTGPIVRSATRPPASLAYPGGHGSHHRGPRRRLQTEQGNGRNHAYGRSRSLQAVRSLKHCNERQGSRDRFHDFYILWASELVHNIGMQTVAIGFLGTTLDRGGGSDRWERWRPTVDLCRHEDLVINRFELLGQARSAALAAEVIADVRTVSPETEVRIHDLDFRDPWDFEEVYGALHDFARAYPFRTDEESYLVHMTTGTHVAQICLFLLTESRDIPGRLIQTSPPRRQRGSEPGTYTIIDLDLSKYDRLASRFRQRHQDDLAYLKSGIDTRNAEFNRLVERIEQVALASRSPILLMGPTGAGKSQLARRVYELKKSRRQVEGPFVEVNCATLRGDATMSALFGHVKGAFTGALQARAGLLRTADKGILFLDE